MRQRILTGAALEAFVKSLVVILALWTLSYQLVIAARWPSYVSVVLFAVLFIIAIPFTAYLRRRTAQPERHIVPNEPRAVLVALLAMALVCAALSLILNRPDADDLGFFHRAIVLDTHLGKPFPLGDTVHNQSGLPGLTSVHLMASYEIGVAFLAKFAHIYPLALYHNGACALASLLIPLAYYLLFREFGFTSLSSLIAASGSIAFLWFDGNNHTSIGNFAFVRLWQGKSIMLTLLCPLVVFFVLRFWRRPTAGTWTMILLSGVAAVGLSGSGLVIIPLLVLLVSAALAINDGYRKSAPFALVARRFVLANLASTYCAMLVLGVLLRVIPMLRSLRTAPEAQWNAESWWVNLTYSTGTGWSLAWYAALLIIGPFLAANTRRTRVALVAAVIAVVLCFNPIAGPLWLKALFNTYWRLAFVLPIAFSAGLVASGTADMFRYGLARPANLARLVGVSLLVILFAGHFRRATFYPSNGVTLKAPLEYRFNGDVLSFCKAAAPLVGNRQLLAPREIVAVLPLLNPSVRLETHRPWVTRSFFREINRKKEGNRRVRAQAFVTGRRNKPRDEDAFETSIRNGVDAVVVGKRCEEIVQATLARSSARWLKAYSNEKLTLFLKE